MSARISRFLYREIEIPEPGHCIVRVPFHPELSQNSGFLHGAILFEVADTAGFIAANSIEMIFSVLTLDYNINFFRPIKEKGIYAEAKVMHKGQSVIICNSSVYDENGKYAAEGRGTYFISEILLSSIKDYGDDIEL
jgi:uncharacterized protein (TIGR00369 family)